MQVCAHTPDHRTTTTSSRSGRQTQACTALESINTRTARRIEYQYLLRPRQDSEKQPAALLQQHRPLAKRLWHHLRVPTRERKDAPHTRTRAAPTMCCGTLCAQSAAAALLTSRAAKQKNAPPTLRPWQWQWPMHIPCVCNAPNPPLDSQPTRHSTAPARAGAAPGVSAFPAEQTAAEQTAVLHNTPCACTHVCMLLLSTVHTGVCHRR